MTEFKGKPYWTADNPHGYSAEELRNLERKAQIEVMKAWFYQNFEDPAKTTPYESAEGGYQWIWGGPYDAFDVLGTEFGEYVPEDVVKEVVAEVQADGLYEWAPKNIRDDDVADGDEGLWPPLLVVQQPEPPLNEPSARQEMLDRLEALETAVKELGELSPMIGHNRPPEPLEDIPLTADDSRTIEQVIGIVRCEAEKAEPEVHRLDQEASKLRSIGLRLGEWLRKRVDAGADGFAKTLGAAAAAALLVKLTGLYEALVGSVLSWSQIVGQFGSEVKVYSAV